MLDNLSDSCALIQANVSNVVVMPGSGEPLVVHDNPDHFIHLFDAEEGGLHCQSTECDGFHLGWFGESGALANQGLAITLALSLHAPNDG